MSKLTPSDSQATGSELVLIVDDQPVERAILKQLLTNQGFEVILACNGLEGIEQFEKHSPSLVFMDVMMPVMDGYEATRRIKALPQGHFTPIIFLTGLEDPDDLKKCIQVGGDDFLSKPAKPAILSARILALQRTRRLYSALHEQHQVLLMHMESEQANELLAHKVFSHAVASRNKLHSGLVAVSHSAASFSGDLVLCGHLPSGGLRVLLADFTGHGLPAAICALPVSEVFHTMTERGCTQLSLLEEVNLKLCQLLPDDRFMAATCLDVDLDRKALTLWSGGMPASLLLQGDALSTLPPKGLPLGILDCYDFAADQLQLACDESSRLLIMSDGLQDLCSPQGTMLSQTGLYNEFLELWTQVDSDVNHLVSEVLDKHCKGSSLDDDVTLVELNFSRMQRESETNQL